MEVTRTADGGIFLSQSSYVRDVLERFKEYVPAAANPVQLPADPKLRLHVGGATKVHVYQGDSTGERSDAEDGAAECPGNIPYKELLGALLWVSQGTRPDRGTRTHRWGVSTYPLAICHRCRREKQQAS